MIGAIVGDIIGSPYEGRRMNFFDYDFPLFNERSTFTDDTILTVATAKAIMEGIPYQDVYLEFGRKYKNKGYGGAFEAWLNSSNPEPYDSWGNGSAMRVGPIGYYFVDPLVVIEEAKKSAEITHNHAFSVDGAQAIALAIHSANMGATKEEIKEAVLTIVSYYDFDKTVEDYRKNYKFDIACKVTVPQALTAFFESDSFEDCIRKSVLMGGDTDTIACIAGSVAEAYYDSIPEHISEKALEKIPNEFLEIIKEFYEAIKKG